MFAEMPVFADLIFVELAACMHAILNFAGLMFAVHANPRKPRTFIPSKYTRYTVCVHVLILSRF